MYQFGTAHSLNSPPLDEWQDMHWDQIPVLCSSRDLLDRILAMHKEAMHKDIFWFFLRLAVLEAEESDTHMECLATRNLYTGFVS